MPFKKLFVAMLTLCCGILISPSVKAWDYPDPTYGTSDPPNYKKKTSSSSGKKGSHGSSHVYSSRFNDPYYGTSNPPGYNAKKAKQMGKIYVPPKAEPLSPIYGTSVSKKPKKKKSR